MAKDIIVGTAEIKGEVRNIILIDESRLKTEGIVRVMWRDELGRRNTNFVKPQKIKKI